MNDATGKTPLTGRTVQAIAQAFGISPPPGLIESLPSGRERGVRREPEHTAAPRQRTAAPSGFARDVPLQAALMVARGPLFRLNSYAVDYAPRPPAIASARKVFALRMPDETMAPWRQAGELIYVDPSRPVRVGDHALVQLADTGTPDEDPLYLIRQIIGPATAPAARQLAAHTLRQAEDFLDAYQVLDRLRVLEWPELLTG